MTYELLERHIRKYISQGEYTKDTKHRIKVPSLFILSFKILRR